MADSKAFPVWNPLKKRPVVCGDDVRIDKKKEYKRLRLSSSNFISKKEVREYIFSRDGYRCCLCGSRDNLQIDHIVSVYKTVYGGLDYNNLNAASNLRTVCLHCNSKRSPME